MTCPPGWRQLKTKCFRLSLMKLNFDDAISECSKQGATLASVSNSEEQEFLASMANQELTWLGGTDRDQEETFSWINGEDWNFTNWAKPNQPNHKQKQDCVELRKDGLWDDVLCSKPLPFICQLPGFFGANRKYGDRPTFVMTQIFLSLSWRVPCWLGSGGMLLYPYLQRTKTVLERCKRKVQG